MKTAFLPLTLLLAAAGAQAAEPIEGPLRLCRALPVATERLACYDALPLAAVLPAAVPAPEAVFGLENRRAAVQDISTTLPGLFEGWERNTRFTLANGQVWQVSDGTSASYYLRNPKVTVRRAALGSFRLEIEGVNQAPRVQRVE
jgi:hypothetical protein